jgi:hypothetical protein
VTHDGQEKRLFVAKRDCRVSASADGQVSAFGTPLSGACALQKGFPFPRTLAQVDLSSLE